MMAKSICILGGDMQATAFLFDFVHGFFYVLGDNESMVIDKGIDKLSQF